MCDLRIVNRVLQFCKPNGQWSFYRLGQIELDAIGGLPFIMYKAWINFKMGCGASNGKVSRITIPPIHTFKFWPASLEMFINWSLFYSVSTYFYKWRTVRLCKYRCDFQKSGRKAVRPQQVRWGRHWSTCQAGIEFAIMCVCVSSW